MRAPSARLRNTSSAVSPVEAHAWKVRNVTSEVVWRPFDNRHVLAVVGCSHCSSSRGIPAALRLAANVPRGTSCEGAPSSTMMTPGRSGWRKTRWPPFPLRASSKPCIRNTRSTSRTRGGTTHSPSARAPSPVPRFLTRATRRSSRSIFGASFARSSAAHEGASRAARSMTRSARRRQASASEGSFR